MTRTKQILLAGTLIPALVLTPFVGAMAQDPAADRGAHAKPDGKGAKAADKGDKVEARKAARAQKGGAEAGETKASADKDEPPKAEGKGRKARAETTGTDTGANKAAAADRGDTVSPKGDGARGDAKAGRMSRKSHDAAPAKADTAATPDNSSKTDKATAADTTEPARGKHNGRADRKDGTNSARGPNADKTASPTGTADAPGAHSPSTPATTNAQRDKGGDGNNSAQRNDNNNAQRDNSANAQRNDGNASAQRDTGKGFGDHGFGNTGDRNQNGRTFDNRQDNRNDNRFGNRQDNRNYDNRGPNGAAVGAAVAAGFAGGFLAATGAQRLDDIRRDRREVREGNSVFIREPGRTIVEEDGRRFIVHDESERFRQLGYDVRREQRGNQFIDVIDRPGGVRIMTYTDPSGRLLRRVRRFPDGREVVLIDNAYDGGIRPYAQDVVVLPPPPLRIPRERYVVDYRDANEGLLYDTLTAPPLAPPPQRYTLDQVRYSPDVRNYVRSVDINTINFDTGSWDVPAEATGKLQALAGAISKAVQKNPNAVFLIEGYTDATGNPQDNLSLSDRRAQSVAAILSKDFKVPPENLTTQGYGDQNPKEKTDGPSAANRRVVVRNVTQLLASSGEAPQSGQ